MLIPIILAIMLAGNSGRLPVRNLTEEARELPANGITVKGQCPRCGSKVVIIVKDRETWEGSEKIAAPAICMAEGCHIAFYIFNDEWRKQQKKETAKR